MDYLFLDFTPDEIKELHSALQTRLQADQAQREAAKSQPTSNQMGFSGAKAKLYEMCKYVKFFVGIDYADVLEITEDVIFSKYQKGETIIREGDSDNKIYYIIRGRASVMKKANDLQRKNIAYLTEGQIFGEVAFIRKSQRIATIVAMEDGTVVLSFRINESKKELYPKAFCRFYENLTKDLAFKLLDTNKRFIG